MGWEPSFSDAMEEVDRLREIVFENRVKETRSLMDIIAYAGHPDASEACRIIIAACKDRLKQL